MAPQDTRIDHIIQLAREVHLVKDRWEPAGQERYEEEVKNFVKDATKSDVIDLVTALEEAAEQGRAMGPFALYPVLIGFVDRFGATSDLLVETYIVLVGAGGRGLDLAPSYLTRAYTIDPSNRYVLWELFTSHHFSRGIPRPSFPSGLKFSEGDLTHERECLRRIIEKYPDDKIASTVFQWLETHNVCYHRSKEVPIPIHEVEMYARPTAGTTLTRLLEQTDP